MTSTNRISRRSVIAGAAVLPFAAIGFRGVTAGSRQSTPEASPGASPEASPGASPMASPTAGNVIEIKTEDIKFDKKTLEIPADTDVTIKVKNEGMLQHDFIIEDTDFGTDLLDSGDETELKVKLKAGEYTYYCSVPGHREAGMEGKLTVK
jgi:uncharacterized cupredoxin-like copper-binding protein